MNHAAVRAVSMHTLNRQRANIVISTLLQGGKALTPDEVSRKERIFERDGALRWQGARVLGYARIGVPLQKLLASLGQLHGLTGSVRNTSIRIEFLIGTFHKDGYILWYDRSRRSAYIVLKDGASPSSLLKAWSHALLISHRLGDTDAIGVEVDDQATLRLLQTTLDELTSGWPQILTALEEVGWDVGISSLETTSSTRIRI